jgi:hypothetical protein
MPTVPFTDVQIAQIRYYAGYTAYAAFGYILSPGMATLDTQLANMSDAEQAILVNTFLAVLPGLETAIDSMSGTLGVAVAAVFTRNVDEQSERNRQFNMKRRRMCAYIGCEPGPELGSLGMMGGYTVVPS